MGGGGGGVKGGKGIERMEGGKEERKGRCRKM